MKKKYIPKRWGQCGRTFTKAQWRRNNFWCSNCQKYQCYDCVGSARICPACGTKASRTIHGISFVGIVVGLIMLPMILLTVLANPPKDQSDSVIIGFMVSLPLFIFFIGLVSYFMVRKQKKQHLEYLSEMPPGTIPVENRPGYNNPHIREYWRKESLKRTTRRAPAYKGTYPHGAFEGLLGDWEYPILSKEQMIEHTIKSERKMIKFSAIFILVGLTSLAFGFYFHMNFYCITPGIIFLFFGGLMVVASYHNKNWVEQENYRETSVMWKLVGFQKTIWAIEEFLRIYNINYRKEMISQSKSDFRYPEYKYVFANGNYITTYYSEWTDGHVYRWINIRYTPSNYIQAKKIQKDLDEFLIKRDLIRRVG
jgi:hypothetical protein